MTIFDLLYLMQIITSDARNTCLVYVRAARSKSFSGLLARTAKKKKKWENVRDAWAGVKGSEQEWFHSQNWPHLGPANVVWLEIYCDEVSQDKS